MSIDLYYASGSPVCRLVNIVGRELELPINIKPMNGWDEIYEPWYLKINPQHKVPAIVDNGYVLWESRAIITYLVNKYAPNHTLYPNDPQIRGKIDAILHFDNGLLFPYMESLCFPSYYTRNEENMTTLDTLIKHIKKLEFMLKGKNYLVGNTRTLGDLSVMTTLTYLESYKNSLDLIQFPNINKWLINLKKELPYYKELIQNPIEETKQMITLQNYSNSTLTQEQKIIIEKNMTKVDTFLETIYPS